MPVARIKKQAPAADNERPLVVQETWSILCSRRGGWMGLGRTADEGNKLTRLLRFGLVAPSNASRLEGWFCKTRTSSAEKASCSKEIAGQYKIVDAALVHLVHDVRHPGHPRGRATPGHANCVYLCQSGQFYKLPLFHWGVIGPVYSLRRSEGEWTFAKKKRDHCIPRIASSYYSPANPGLLF